MQVPRVSAADRRGDSLKKRGYTVVLIAAFIGRRRLARKHKRAEVALLALTHDIAVREGVA